MEKRAYVDPDWTPDVENKTAGKTASDKKETVKQLDEAHPVRRLSARMAEARDAMLRSLRDKKK